jgi:hypothetical protein
MREAGKVGGDDLVVVRAEMLAYAIPQARAVGVAVDE